MALRRGTVAGGAAKGGKRVEPGVALRAPGLSGCECLPIQTKLPDRGANGTQLQVFATPETSTNDSVQTIWPEAGNSVL